jgi:hypothetical protein
MTAATKASDSGIDPKSARKMLHRLRTDLRNIEEAIRAFERLALQKGQGRFHGPRSTVRPTTVVDIASRRGRPA